MAKSVKLWAGLVVVLACGGGKDRLDTDGNGRISVAEICAGYCACEIDRPACEASCAGIPDPAFYEEVALCVLDAVDEGRCVPTEPDDCIGSTICDCQEQAAD